MTRRPTPFEWLVFLTLAFCWGSSYLFIKLAVDDFGTFTLVALRLAVGAALLWSVVLLSRVELPRSPRMYGHLAVMGAINIAIPFVLITWAEQSADSSLAAILTSPVPLFAAVLAPFFLPDEPLRLNGLIGLGLGFIGVVILVSPGLSGSGGDLMAMLALLAAAASYACGAIYARRNVRGMRPMVPAVFQVTFAGLYTLGPGLPDRAATGRQSGLRSDLFDPVVGPARLGPRVPVLLPPARAVGGDPPDDGRVRHPSHRDRPGLPGPRRDRSTVGSSSARWPSSPASRSSTDGTADGACSADTLPPRRRRRIRLT